MKIGRHAHVTVQYSLTTGRGVQVRDAGSRPIQYVHGCGALFARLEAALENHGVGEVVRVKLLPEDAFGRRDVDLVQEVPRDALPPGEDIRVGNTLTGHDDAGQAVDFRITAVEDGRVVLDANHPLAGETLVFEVEIQAVRTATPEEIAQATPTKGG